MRQTLDAFTRGYVECACWLHADEIGGNATIDDLPDSVLAQMVADCDDFQACHGALLEAAIPLGHPGDWWAGYDFWLTRNRHGAGFWGRGLGPIGDELTEAAHAYGEASLYVGDDGAVYHA